MPDGVVRSYLPKEVRNPLAAIPFSALTAITTVDTDVVEIVVQNTTGSSITLSVKDGQGTSQFLEDVINIDPGNPIILPFYPGAYCKGGVQWQAGATGLVGAIYAHTVMGLSMGAASAQTNNLPTPA